MLIEKTATGKINKVDYAIAQIRLHEPSEGYYVAFSGGKDSCVILDLVKRAGVKYDAHYNWLNRAIGEKVNNFYIRLLIGVRKMYGSISRHTTYRIANCTIKVGSVSAV